MQNKTNNNAAYYVSIIMLVLFFGCSVEQTHKTLTFFFDGVDKVIFFNSYLSEKDSIRKDAISRRDAVLKKNRPDMVVHQPYKEKKCDQCHTPDKRLLMPMPALCFKCHQNFNEKYAVVHGPVASGNCLNCHNQHSSRNPKLLIRQGQQICLFCHNSSLVFANKVHRDIEDAECTLCHSPHGGKTRFMIKDNISRDANRIALMSELTYRHLYGQIYCKIPGDINSIIEIYILDTKGAIVATAHPDINGKFFVANLHPDQNYTFHFKNNIPDCKINLLDNNGTLLYIVEKNKKGNYVFDKTAYETVHEVINDSHLLEDTLVGGYVTNYEVKTNIDQVKVTTNPEGGNSDSHSSDTVSYGKKLVVYTLLDSAAAKDANAELVAKRGKILVSTIPDSVSTEELLKAERAKDTSNTKELANDKNKPDTISYKGKIIVKALPPGKSTEELMGDNKSIDAAINKGIVTNAAPGDSIKKGRIVAKPIPDNISTEEVLQVAKASDTMGRKEIADDQTALAPTQKKGKIIVNEITDSAGFREMVVNNIPNKLTGITLADATYNVAGKTLPKLSEQIFQYNSGIVVWVLNDRGKLLGEGKLNAKGNFLLNETPPYYHLKLAQTDKSVVSQVIYLNDDMELIEIIDKKNTDGHISYSRSVIKNTTNAYKLKGSIDESTELISTINFDNSKSAISKDAQNELNKVVSYLLQNQAFKIQLVGYTDFKDTSVNSIRHAEDRVSEVGDYLIMNGVDHDRISGSTNKKQMLLNTGEKSGAGTTDHKYKRVEIYIKDN